MRASRADQLLEGLNSMARKVFDAVPLQDSWTIQDITTELGRTGHRIEYATVQGCLRQLANVKLVTEVAPREFKRNVKPKEQKQVSNMKVVNKTQKDPRSIDEIFDQLLQQVESLRDNLIAASVEVSEKTGKDQEDLDKLRQLHQLIKSL